MRRVIALLVAVLFATGLAGAPGALAQTSKGATKADKADTKSQADKPAAKGQKPRLLRTQVGAEEIAEVDKITMG